ncbi:unnamed protein product [Discula destructiva]
MEPTEEAKKDRLLGALEYLDAKQIPHFKVDVFHHFGFGKTSGWKVIRDARRDQRRSPQRLVETRGRHRLLTPDRLAAIERLIETEGFDTLATPWAAMPAAAGLDVKICGETVRRALKTPNSRFCTACESKWVSPKLMSMREEYCRRSLEARPSSEDWRHFRFTDEVNFVYNTKGKLCYCRRPWERACANCLVGRQIVEKTPDVKQKQLHVWAAVGYNGFRDGPYWYDVPGNSNAQIIQQVYNDAILQPIIGTWVRRGDQFILQRDGDSGSGDRGNTVTAWRDEHNIVNVFNCPQSPDLIASPIKKAWRGPKEYIRQQPYLDQATLKTAVQSGFDALDPITVNHWIDDIPNILRACVENEGNIVGY